MKPGQRAFIGVLAIAAAACGGSIAGPTPEPSGPKVAERDVRFDTSDDVTLRGRLFGDSVSGVVLAHMYPADATSWYPAARVLADRGYLVLAFDFRGYAESDGEKDASKAPVDLSAAVGRLRTAGAGAVALVGASMGGTAALALTARTDPSAVVAISAPIRFMGLDALVAAPRISAPVLLVAAQGDGPAFESLQTLSGEIDRATTRVFDGEAHGTNLLIDRPEALEEIVSFLGRNAPPRAARSSPVPR